MTRPLLALPFVLLLAVAGCGTSGGNDVDDPSIDGSTSTTVTTSTTSPRTDDIDPDQVVWQQSTSGGFAPKEMIDGEVPDVTIYGDGRIIMTSPDKTARYWRPAQLMEARISAKDLNAFLDEATASGLVDTATDYGSPGITDQASTRVTLVAHGPPQTIDVYALGFQFPDDLDLRASGVSKAEAARRVELRTLIAKPRSLAGTGTPYVPTQVRAITYADAPSGGRTPWPGPPLSAFPEPADGDDRSCLVIEGGDAHTVYEAALANPGVTWTSGGRSHQIVVSPLLPGQEGCPPS